MIHATAVNRETTADTRQLGLRLESNKEEEKPVNLRRRRRRRRLHSYW